MIGEVCERSLVVLGVVLPAAAAWTLVTGRWPLWPESCARPRWMSGWAVCLALIGLGHLPVFDELPHPALGLLLLGLVFQHLARGRGIRTRATRRGEA
ncbi:hypothetical protein ACIPSE_01970 [Streptomyces sp. NPDC090106]|uniref:hypothetical protein n=1 Tax=Streptomyces sp. NPDC090106 TaxID=3365946 RepID=UPI003814625C